MTYLCDSVVLAVKQTKHGSNEVLICNQVTLGPRDNRLNDQLLKILCSNKYKQPHMNARL